MNETQSTVETPGEWLTVSQAAAALKISERTVQRKCKAGKLAARLETSETGAQWLIDRDKLPTGADKLPPFPTRVPTGAANSSEAAAIGADTLPTGADNAVAVEMAKLQGYAARDMELAIGDAVKQAIAPLVAQNEVMSAMLETMQTTHESLLREMMAMRAEAKSTVEIDRTLQTGQIARDGANSGAGGKVSGGAGNVGHAQPRREPRSLWRAFWGLR